MGKGVKSQALFKEILKKRIERRKEIKAQGLFRKILEKRIERETARLVRILEYRVEHDPVADALYIKVKEGKVADTLEVESGILVDLNEDGEIIGLEILEFSKRKIDLSKIFMRGIEAVVQVA